MFTQMRRNLSALTFVLSAALLAGGCADPDPEARFNEFVDASEDFRGGGDDDEAECAGSDWGDELTGPYLMALRNPLIPTFSLFFEVSFELEDADERTYSVTFQPLRTDLDDTGEPREDPRTPVGDKIVVRGAQMDESGYFSSVNFLYADGIPEGCAPDPDEADEGLECEVMVSGDANPISYSDIFATLDMAFCVYDVQQGFCGNVSAGKVSRPQPVGLDNQPFNAVISDDYPATDLGPNCPTSEE